MDLKVFGQGPGKHSAPRAQAFWGPLWPLSLGGPPQLRNSSPNLMHAISSRILRSMVPEKWPLQARISFEGPFFRGDEHVREGQVLRIWFEVPHHRTLQDLAPSRANILGCTPTQQKTLQELRLLQAAVRSAIPNLRWDCSLQSTPPYTVVLHSRWARWGVRMWRHRNPKPGPWPEADMYCLQDFERRLLGSFKAMCRAS